MRMHHGWVFTLQGRSVRWRSTIFVICTRQSCLPSVDKFDWGSSALSAAPYASAPAPELLRRRSYPAHKMLAVLEVLRCDAEARTGQQENRGGGSGKVGSRSSNLHTPAKNPR